MHAIAEVVVPPTKDVFASVKQVMDHFLERDEDDEPKPNGHGDWWDFWIIGGRFSGHKTQARIGRERLAAFHKELNRRKVTVSGLVCGKEELNPASQIPMVDALWREMFPGFGEQCMLFQHARDQYRKDGFYADDVCTVTDLPADLECARLLVAAPHWKGNGELECERMWQTEFWNGVEHLNTTFDGKVKPALDAMIAAKGTDTVEGRRMHRCPLAADWLVVTVDYHN